jgi:hypothetical protein
MVILYNLYKKANGEIKRQKETFREEKNEIPTSKTEKAICENRRSEQEKKTMT